MEQSIGGAQESQGPANGINGTAHSIAQVLCLSDDPVRGSLIRDAVLTAWPSAVVEVAAERLLPKGPLRGVACLVLDAGAGGGIDALRRLRATGFGGEAILLVPEPAGDLAPIAATLGVRRTVVFRELAREMPSALESVQAVSAGSDEFKAAHRELRRVQQLIAAGEVAARVHHEINNPMTALLMEVQLLEMSMPNEESQAAVHRLLELLRRVIATVKQLDGVGRTAS